MTGGGLPRTARILRPADFARVYGLRRSVAAGPLVLYAAAREPETADSRIGLSVSRRIGSAVVRNRWKRRLREAFRVVRSRLPAGHDFVVVVRSGLPPVGGAAAREVEESLVALAGRVVSRPGIGPERPRAAGQAQRGRRT